MTNKSICFAFCCSSNQEVTQVRTPKQEAHWLKSNTDPLQPLPWDRKCYQDRRTDGMGGEGTEPGSEGLCQCIHVHIWAYDVKMERKLIMKWVSRIINLGHPKQN